MEHVDIIFKAWPVFGAFMALIVWAIRQEGKIKFLDEKVAQITLEHNTLRAEHNALNNSTLQELSKIREALARIEGRLSVRDDE